MSSTSPRVSFGLYDLAIKPDSTPAATDIQSFSKIADLKTENVNPRPYATYEPSFWLLDGGYKFLPSTATYVHCGWVSSSQSNGSGVFSTAPVLTITFGSVHFIDGLVLRFSQYTGDWANSINVKLYDAADTQISSTDYTPSAWEWSTSFTEEVLVKKIVITFNSTNKANRYLRLTGIEYGELVYFEDTDIIEADVMEQINMLGTELPVGTAELLLHSTDANFSILNPSGDYAALQQRQPLTVYEQVDNIQIMIGKFYLKNWKNESETKIRLEAGDLLDILDSIICRGGGPYGSATVSYLVDMYLTAINVPYELDPDLASITLSGWIPYTTYREALQQIAFAAGGYIKCARGSVLQILKTKIAAQETTWNTEIASAQKGNPQSIELLSQVTGVDVTAHTYIIDSGTVTLFSGTLPVGTHEIVFDKPMYSVTGSGYSSLQAYTNYAIVTVTTEGTVTLTGTAWLDTKQIYSARLSGEIIENIIKVTDATLVSSANGQSVADRVFAYYSQRYKQTVRLYAPLVEVGNIALIDTLYGQQLIAGIEKMDLDLAGGFIADIVAIGGVYGMG